MLESRRISYMHVSSASSNSASVPPVCLEDPETSCSLLKTEVRRTVADVESDDLRREYCEFLQESAPPEYASLELEVTDLLLAVMTVAAAELGLVSLESHEFAANGILSVLDSTWPSDRVRMSVEFRSQPANLLAWLGAVCCTSALSLRRTDGKVSERISTSGAEIFSMESLIMLSSRQSSRRIEIVLFIRILHNLRAYYRSRSV